MTKHDEFAFMNRQLAGMLQSGLPLEGALRQLSHSMQRSPLREELLALEHDLSQGIPLPDALSRRQLPAFYVSMLKVGVKGNQLPAVLLLLADYYQKVNSIWTRLKGLMVYPAIVLCFSLLLSLMVALLYGHFAARFNETYSSFFPADSAMMPGAAELALSLWLPVLLLLVATGGVAGALSIPSWRRYLRWRLPAFHEAGLAQLASSLALMLENGCSQKDALELLRQLEAGTPAQPEIERWLQEVANGRKNFGEIAIAGRTIPPLFVWLVAGNGEDWVGGFRQAAQIYHARAMHQLEILLYAVLPASVIALGILIVSQVVPMARLFLSFMQALTNVGE